MSSTPTTEQTQGSQGTEKSSSGRGRWIASSLYVAAVAVLIGIYFGPRIFPSQDEPINRIKEDADTAYQAQADNFKDRMGADTSWKQADGRVDAQAWNASRIVLAKEHVELRNNVNDVLATANGTSTLEPPRAVLPNIGLSWLAAVYKPRHIWVDDGAIIRMKNTIDPRNPVVVTPLGREWDVNQDALDGAQTMTMHDRLVHEYGLPEDVVVHWVATHCDKDDNCDAVVRTERGEILTLHNVGHPLELVAVVKETDGNGVTRTTAVVPIGYNALDCAETLGGQLYVGPNNFVVMNQQPSSGMQFLPNDVFQVHVTDDDVARDTCRTISGNIIPLPHRAGTGKPAQVVGSPAGK